MHNIKTALLSGFKILIDRTLERYKDVFSILFQYHQSKYVDNRKNMPILIILFNFPLIQLRDAPIQKFCIVSVLQYVIRSNVTQFAP